MDVRSSGRRIRKRVGTFKRIAELVLRDAEVKIARDEFGFARSDASIQKFLERFLGYSDTNHSPATFKRYRAVIDHFKRFLKLQSEIVFLSQIGAGEIDGYKIFRKGEWVNPNGDSGECDEDVSGYTRKGARARAINFEIGALRTIFNMVIKWSYMEGNPAQGVVKFKVNDSKKPRLLAIVECKRLLECSPAELRDISCVFLNTGMRKAELENLGGSISIRRRLRACLTSSKSKPPIWFSATTMTVSTTSADVSRRGLAGVWTARG